MLATKRGNMKKGMSPRERGVVLVIVLIVLVAMMFAGMAMMRSVNTATLVAGNMAFRKGASHQGDTGIEAAIEWLEANNTGTTLQSNQSHGYFASVSNPPSGKTWDYWWANSLDTSPVGRPVNTAVISGQVWTLASTINGSYTVSYIIHRLCGSAGPSSTSNCASSPATNSTSTGNSMGAGSYAWITTSQIYYRITSRTEGPRNTVTYTQAIIAM